MKKKREKKRKENMNSIMILIFVVIAFTCCQEANLEFFEKDSTSEHSIKLARRLFKEAVVRHKRHVALRCPGHEWERIFSDMGYIVSNDENRASDLILLLQPLLDEISPRNFWIGMGTSTRDGVPIMLMRVISNCK